MLKGILLGFFCFLLFMSHIFIFHKFNIKRRFYFMAILFFLVLLVYIFLFIFISEEKLEKIIKFFTPLSLIGFINGAFLHFFFGYFYLHFIQIIDRSPSTRIMVEIEDTPEKRITFNEIKQRYSIDKKVSCELEDMVILGRLKKQGDYYVNTAKGSLHCNLFKFIRKYLKLGRIR